MKRHEAAWPQEIKMAHKQALEAVDRRKLADHWTLEIKKNPVTGLCFATGFKISQK